MTKKRKIKNKAGQEIVSGFDDISKDKSVWRADQFGKRKVCDLEMFNIRLHVDNLGLATDYADKDRLKMATDEYKRRLELQLRNNASSRRLFKKQTRKKYNSKSIKSKIDKMSIKKIQKLYFLLLKKDTGKKSRKKSRKK
jgi:hypothetical protein